MAANVPPVPPPWQRMFQQIPANNICFSPTFHLTRISWNNIARRSALGQLKDEEKILHTKNQAAWNSEVVINELLLKNSNVSLKFQIL